MSQQPQGPVDVELVRRDCVYRPLLFGRIKIWEYLEFRLMRDNEINNDTTNIHSDTYLPDGRPLPLILNSTDLILLLRLDDRDPALAKNTLKYYRDLNWLKGFKVGNRIVYHRDEVLKFIETLTSQEIKKTG